MRRPRAILLLLLVALCSAAARAEASEADDVAQATKRLAVFKRELQAALQQGLARGPAEAIDACRLRAPEIAGELSRDGVRIGRTSHRLRNPSNAGPGWVEPLLAAYLVDEAERKARLVQLSEGRRGYVEPILVQPPCLVCHGETLAPDVAARIDTLYPDDRARGFHTGDLRGVFWLELPADE